MVVVFLRAGREGGDCLLDVRVMCKVYLRDGSAQTILSAACLGQKLQIKVAT